MLVKIKGELRGVTKKEFVRKNGEKGFDCKVVLEVECEPVQLPCDLSLADAYAQNKIVKGMQYDFLADYHPFWKFNQMVVKSYSVLK